MKLFCKALLKFFVIFSLLFLSACASFYDVSVDKPDKYQKPKQIDQSFDISGRFLIKSPQKNSYGNFNWVKGMKNEELDLNTPLGETVAKITIESGTATLTTSDQKTYTGDNLDDLMDEQLGFVMPLNYLHYWIQGVGLPNIPITKNIDDGFEQLGWKVEYLQWQDINHPKIIQCTKGDLVIKLLIKW